MAVGKREVNGGGPRAVLLCTVLVLAVPAVLGLPVSRPAVQCRGEPTSVKVNYSQGEDCSRGSLANRTCTDLQDVLLNIAGTETRANEPYSCIEVDVYPGTYLMNRAIAIDNQSLILRGVESGVQNVSVTFNFSGSFDPTQTSEAFYVIRLTNLEYAEFSGIEFYNSPGIIGFDNISTVVITECSFRYFYQGAVDIFKSIMVYVDNCLFEHNGPVSIVKAQQYRGHAGGLSIGTEEEEPTSVLGVHFSVKDCVFWNNTSNPLANIFLSTTELLRAFVFPGRGGGCAILMNTSFPANATIENSLFEDNYSSNFGGGLYLGFSGYSSHVILVNGTKFKRNRSGTAGGLHYGFLEGVGQGVDIMLMVINSEFVENSATYGGGTYFYAAGPTTRDGQLSNFARLENTTFLRNSAEGFGAALGAVTILFLTYTGGIKPLEVIDCRFIDNLGRSGGALGTAYLPLSFKGENVFRGSVGHTLVVLGAQIEVHGVITFQDNGALTLDSAALYLTSFAQVKLYRGAQLSFEDNQGQLGAAVELATQRVPEVYSKLLFNPLCTFISENRTQPPDDWNVSLYFSGNNATYASAVYADNVDLCSWIQFREPFFDQQRAFNWSSVHFSDNVNFAHSPDVHNPLYYVQTPPVSINVSDNVLSAYPGQDIEISIEAFDEFGKTSGAFIRVTDTELDLVFSRSATSFSMIESAAFTTTLAAVAKNVAAAHGEMHEILVEIILIQSVQVDHFRLMITKCPAGYVLVNADLETKEGFLVCGCDYDNPDVVDCDGTTILLPPGRWATTGSDNDLSTHPCPPYYCVCHTEFAGTQSRDYTSCNYAFSSEQPDHQCHRNRKGVLCGECVDGKGVSVLLNYCVTCASVSGMLVIALVAADVLALIGLFLLKKPIPDWLYPCLFYLQVLPYMTLYFPVTFDKVHPYLYYVSSALSLYFVYDFCIYEDMDPLVSYFLRYIPLFTTIAVGIVFVAIRYQHKMLRVPWHGLWWVILLQYTHILYSSMSILNCPIIAGQSRWFIDGSVHCFHHGHAPMGLLAILVLILCVSTIVIIVLYSLRWLERPRWIRSVVQPLKETVGQYYTVWPAVELGRRFVLVLFIVAFPGNDYPTIFILMVMVATFGLLQPYKHMLTNMLEIVLSVIVLTMLLLRNTGTVIDELQIISVQNSTSGEEREDKFEGVTDMTALLSVFYYFPLAVFLVLAGAWVVSVTWQYAPWSKSPKNEDSSNLPPEYHQVWRFTQPTSTIVELSARFSSLSRSGVHHNLRHPTNAQMDDQTMDSHSKL